MTTNNREDRAARDLAYADGYNDGFRQGKQSRAEAFTAYNQAIEDAKAAIRAEKVDDPYAAPTFINAIARKCSPHVYVNRLAAAAGTAAPPQSDESRYVVIDGERRRVIPCPDGRPDCEVLHTEPVADEGAR